MWVIQGDFWEINWKYTKQTKANISKGAPRDMIFKEKEKKEFKWTHAQ
jgi:hypothetical protein